MPELRWVRAGALANRNRQRQHADRLAIGTGRGINRLWELGPVPEEPDAERKKLVSGPSPARLEVRLLGAVEVQLNQAWVAAREGRAHLVLLSGEPGIGKSRLALELGRRVRAEGHVVASARAYEAAGRLPWGPVVDLLRSAALRSHIDTLGTVWRAELARLLPELLEASQSTVPSRSGDLAQRHRLFDAVGRAVIGDRPRLLIIDDLQWCDAETIEVIGFVVRSGPTAPALIVGTVRSEEIPEHHPLVGLVDALAHDKAVTTVPLDRLDEATTATLAARLRNADTIDPELAARLWMETEGNPLFVIEVLRAGISTEGSQAALTPTMRDDETSRPRL